MRTYLPATAKVNLGLEVVGRRADGMHELCSIMVNVSLVDLVVLDGEASGDREDLAVRAGEALQRFGARPARIDVSKQIPMGAGLGGGSADAAAVVRHAAALGATLDPRQQLELAMFLGADVPFQLIGGRALVQGAGEIVTSLRHVPAMIALTWPGIHCSTADVFAVVEAGDFSSGDTIRAAAGQSSELESELPNALEAPALRVYPQLADCRARLTAAGWRPRFSGSGSSFFQVCAALGQAERLRDAAAGLGWAAWVVRTLPRRAHY